MSKPIPGTEAYRFSDDMKFLQKAVVLHPEEKNLFLALKRSPESFTRPNDWDLPGGNVNYRQPAEDSMRQEIQEESGLEVEELIPRQVISDFNPDDQIYFLFIGYESKAKDTQVTISHEHTEFKWVTKDEFKSLSPESYLTNLIEKTL